MAGGGGSGLIGSVALTFGGQKLVATRLRRRSDSASEMEVEPALENFHASPQRGWALKGQEKFERRACLSSQVRGRNIYSMQKHISQLKVRRHRLLAIGLDDIILDEILAMRTLCIDFYYLYGNRIVV
jgi:hypothetical protein